MNSNKATITLSSVIALSLGTSALHAADNPFQLNTLEQGYQVADASTKAKEGKCGGGKCGAHKKKKAKEGSCSAEKAKESGCHAEKK